MTTQWDLFREGEISKKKVKGLKKPNKKKEEKAQIQICKYLRLQYPKVIFTCDLASGMNLPIHIAAKNKSMRSSRGLPDLFIAHRKISVIDKDCKLILNGLFIEIKSKDVTIYKKDGTLRKDPHLEEQNEILNQLTKQGYKAVFACGFEEAKKIIDNYLQR